jgi:hypothetical protein
MFGDGAGMRNLFLFSVLFYVYLALGSTCYGRLFLYLLIF